MESLDESRGLLIGTDRARLLGGFLRAMRIDRGLPADKVSPGWFPNGQAVEAIEHGKVRDVVHLTIGAGNIFHAFDELARLFDDDRLRPAPADVEHVAAFLGVDPSLLANPKLVPFRWHSPASSLEVMA